MTTEEPFQTDQTDIGDLESEQLYLEVNKYCINMIFISIIS